MPLMVDPSSGQVLGNPSASLISYFPAGPSSSKNLATSATVSRAAVASASTSTGAHKGNTNMTQALADEMATQQGMDSTTPRNLLLGFCAILILCMIIQHPRFLARLFASIPTNRRKRTKQAPSMAVYAFSGKDSSVSSSESPVVGGGGLLTGWFLSRGNAHAATPPPSIRSQDYGHMDDPFESPFDDPAPALANPSTSASTILPPPHIAPMLSKLPYAKYLLLAPLAKLPSPFNSSAKVTQMMIIAVYLALIGIALMWQSDVTPPTADKGYGNDFARSGLVAMTQVPVAVALGVRGNLIGLCTGRGYERLKVFHKIVGRIVFLASAVHMLFWTHKWTKMGAFMTYSSKDYVIHGWLAFAALLLIIVTSLPWVRNKAYGIFEIAHSIGIVLLLAGLGMHVQVAVPWCLAAMFIYILSIVLSVTKTRLAHAELLALPSSSTTLVSIPSLRTGWRAGQHVRLRIPSLGFPLGLESHPFTIASAPDGDGMVLMCKKVGGWTERLFTLASGGSSQPGRSFTPGAPIRATVILEGPYGGLGNTLLPAFSSVMLVAGGSGITHALSLSHDLTSKAASGVVRARTVDLIWVVRTEQVAEPLIPTLVDMVNDARVCEINSLKEKRVSPTALRIHIYVSRCPLSSPLSLLSGCLPQDLLDSDDILADRPHVPNRSHLNSAQERKTSEADKEKLAYLSRNPSSSSSLRLRASATVPLSSISAHPARPDLPEVLASIAEETMFRHGRQFTLPSGICVSVCGPDGLVSDTRDAVRGLETYKARAVGGVELEEEAFGF